MRDNLREAGSIQIVYPATELMETLKALSIRTDALKHVIVIAPETEDAQLRINNISDIVKDDTLRVQLRLVQELLSGCCEYMLDYAKNNQLLFKELVNKVYGYIPKSIVVSEWAVDVNAMLYWPIYARDNNISDSEEINNIVEERMTELKSQASRLRQVAFLQSQKRGKLKASAAQYDEAQLLVSKASLSCNEVIDRVLECLSIEEKMAYVDDNNAAVSLLPRYYAHIIRVKNEVDAIVNDITSVCPSDFMTNQSEKSSFDAYIESHCLDMFTAVDTIYSVIPSLLKGNMPKEECVRKYWDEHPEARWILDV